MGKNQHVVPHKSGWAVVAEGAKKATSVEATQKEAIEKAQEIAKNQKTSAIVHGKDGKVRDKKSFS